MLMKVKSQLDKDTQAMLKIDTLVQKDNPYEHKIGGEAYVAKRREKNSVTTMYNRSDEQKKRTWLDERKDRFIYMILGIVVVVVIAIVVIVLTI